jgi:uncharacterized protein (DUF736 family)|tara:strand:+ start:31 stop:249 length:219 start_codon:yes stop_codon:yes gene_type:complete
MAYEQKDKSGSLFPNDKKGNDKAPDMTGTFTLNGTKWNLAGWKTKSKEGKAYMSLKVSEPQGKKEESDDLPF